MRRLGEAEHNHAQHREKRTEREAELNEFKYRLETLR
jgi:hypothetical protein